MIIAPFFMLQPTAAIANATATADIVMSANVPNTCYINNLAPIVTPSNVGATSVSNTTNGSVTISYGNTLADPITAIATPSVVTYSVNAYCNYAAHNVALKSDEGGLVTGSNQTTVGAFDHRINYAADFAWGSVHPSITTVGNLGTANAVPVVDNEIAPVPTNLNSTLTVATAAGTNPLVAGTYGDTLRISFGASL